MTCVLVSEFVKLIWRGYPPGEWRMEDLGTFEEPRWCHMNRALSEIFTVDMRTHLDIVCSFCLK
jgi:hypothetical protein